MVVSLDPQTGQVTLVSQFTHTPPLIAESQGNMQALANGDWFLGWGQEPFFSEFSAEGKLLFDAHFPAARAVLPRLPLRLDGHAGAPAGVRLPARRRRRGEPSTRAGTAPRSWPPGGCSPGPPVEPAARSRRRARSGFETAIALPAGTAGPDVAVQALDARRWACWAFPRSARSRGSAELLAVRSASPHAIRHAARQQPRHRCAGFAVAGMCGNVPDNATSCRLSVSVRTAPGG